MAEEESRKQYGDIKIGGHAVVQVGDRFERKEKNYRIQTAYLFLQNESELKRLGFSQAVQLNNLHLPPTHAPSFPVNGQSPQRMCETQNVESSNNNRFFHQRHVTDGYRWSWFLKNVQGCLSLPDRDFESESNQGKPRHMSKPKTLCNRPSAGQVQLGNELITVLGLVVSFLIGRNASIQDISTFLTKCRSDPTLPLLTSLLGFMLARIIYVGNVSHSLSPHDELGITLEDAYGLRRFVTMSICSDYRIFRSFLEFHYRDHGRETGERLMKAGQFNFMLGSRRGAVLNDGHWEIESGSNVVNALYLTAREARCVHCKGDLVVSKTGELHCLLCRVFFRDYDTLQPRVPSSDNLHSMLESDFSQTSELRDAFSWAHGLVEYLDGAQIELKGLRHIDLRIMPSTSTKSNGKLEHRSKDPTKEINFDHKETSTEDDDDPEEKVDEILFDNNDLTSSNNKNTSDVSSSIPVVDRSFHVSAENRDRLIWDENLRSGVEGYSSDDGRAPWDVIQESEFVRESKSDDEKSNRFAKAIHISEASPRTSKKHRPKSILKPPRIVPFPEYPNPVREGIAPLHPADYIPPDARWTKISRTLVNPEALDQAKERYEERDDHVIVLRVLTREYIQQLALKTQDIRERREEKWKIERQHDAV